LSEFDLKISLYVTENRNKKITSTSTEIFYVTKKTDIDDLSTEDIEDLLTSQIEKQQPTNLLFFVLLCNQTMGQSMGQSSGQEVKQIVVCPGHVHIVEDIDCQIIQEHDGYAIGRSSEHPEEEVVTFSGNSKSHTVKIFSCQKKAEVCICPIGTTHTSRMFRTRSSEKLSSNQNLASQTSWMDFGLGTLFGMSVIVLLQKS
jgi:hypothetical protein